MKNIILIILFLLFMGACNNTNYELVETSSPTMIPGVTRTYDTDWTWKYKIQEWQERETEEYLEQKHDQTHIKSMLLKSGFIKSNELMKIYHENR